MRTALRPTVDSSFHDCSLFRQQAEQAYQRFLASNYFTLADEVLPPKGWAGVYILFYRGNNPLYRVWSQELPHVPIYIGKAVGELVDRLRDHIKSLNATTGSNWGLSAEDFVFKLVAVPLTEAWVGEGLERWFIDKFKPLWNTTVRGFGNKVQGGTREETKISDWDQLHPGRKRSQNKADPAARALLCEVIRQSASRLLFEHNLLASVPPDEIAAMPANSDNSVDVSSPARTPVPAPSLVQMTLPM